MKDELMDSLSKGNFTMRILYEQLANIQKMGPVGQVMGMIPGLSNSGLFTKVRTCVHAGGAAELACKGDPQCGYINA